MSKQLTNFQKTGHDRFINEYVVDTLSDMNAIDKTILLMGSSVFVIATGDAYILDGSKEWRKI